MIRLHGYWRSTASYRVRIALNLKGVPFESLPHDLRSGAQRHVDYLAINPQGLVPAMEVEGQTITQSLAILDWLEERFPTPSLLPPSMGGRALVRAMSAIVCSDIHPLNNLRVLEALRTEFSADQASIDRWIARWIGDGFRALEGLMEMHGGLFALGDTPTFADCCLIPQVYSARRFNVALDAYPRIRSVAFRCDSLPAFSDAHPEYQADSDQRVAATKQSLNAI